jgi:hypothetical protein
LPRSTTIASGGGEGLGGRADLKDGFGADRLRAALATDAEALGINEPVAGDDADHRSGNVESLHAAGHEAFEIRGERVNSCLRVG